MKKPVAQASPLLLAILALAAPDGWAEDDWRWKNDPAVPPIDSRYGHASIWTGQELLIWGGQRIVDGTAKGLVNDGAAYNPRTRTWRALSLQNAPSAREEFSAVWTGREMIIWGGGDPESRKDGARYDPVLDKWSPVQLKGAPGSRRSHSAVWTGSEMVIWGGVSFQAPSADGPRGDGGRYNPDTDSWRIFSSQTAGRPPARLRHRAVWTGQEMLVSGGEVWESHNFRVTVRIFDDLWSYNPVADSWRLLLPEGLGYRSSHAAVWTGSELLVWGGWGGVPRITGVGTDPRWLLADGLRFQPADGRWTPMNTMGQPGPRYSPIAEWTGRELVILGGSVDYSRDSTRTGGRYEPALDSWTPTTTNGAPPRIGYGASGVWTGREMLLFTGHSSSPLTDDSIFAYGPAGLYEGDVLPDVWQRQYFGEDNPAAFAEVDADGDGQNNLAEFVAGTNPTEAESRFRLTVSVDGPIVSLSFAPRWADRTYFIEAADDLKANGFRPLAEATTIDDGERRMVRVNQPDRARGFFRIRIQPQ